MLMAQLTMTVMPMSREEITHLRSMTFPFFIGPWFRPCFHPMIAHSTINNVLSSTFTLSRGRWKFSPGNFFAPFHCHFVNCGWNLHTLHNCVRGGAHDCVRDGTARGGRVYTEESVRAGSGLFSCTVDGTSTSPLLVLCLECNRLNSSSRAQLWCVNRPMPQP